MFRWLTAGESHGRALVAICDGVPAGVRITSGDVAAALARRRAGYGRGARMKFEQDEVELTGGVRHGRTLGGPVALRIANTEWPKWETVMAPDPGDEFVLADEARNARLTRHRPGHPPATPTWPGCRSTATTRPAPPWSGPVPGRRRPGSRWARSPAASCGRP